MLAFCNLNFIDKHFKFLKTVAGKGYFNVFLASMFLVGGGLWGIIMASCLGAIGLFFILISCACIEGYEESYTDVDAGELKNEVKNSFSKKDKSDIQADNSTLLDDA